MSLLFRTFGILSLLGAALVSVMTKAPEIYQDFRACPAALKSFDRALLRGQWVAAAYSRSMGLKWRKLWRRDFANTTLDRNPCMTYDIEDEASDVRFDIMNRNNATICYGWNLRTTEYIPSKWVWEALQEFKVITVLAAAKINENNTMYGWFISVECDQNGAVSAWTIFINQDLYQTTFLELFKLRFAENLKVTLGINYYEWVEPNVSSSCECRWTQRSNLNNYTLFPAKTKGKYRHGKQLCDLLTPKFGAEGQRKSNRHSPRNLYKANTRLYSSMNFTKSS